MESVQPYSRWSNLSDWVTFAHCGKVLRMMKVHSELIDAADGGERFRVVGRVAGSVGNAPLER